MRELNRCAGYLIHGAGSSPEEEVPFRNGDLVGRFHDLSTQHEAEDQLVLLKQASAQHHHETPY